MSYIWSSINKMQTKKYHTDEQFLNPIEKS
jgi:hypothetical protein